MVPALVSSDDRRPIDLAVDATESGREGRMTVMTAQGWTIGPEIDPSARVTEGADERPVVDRRHRWRRRGRDGRGQRRRRVVVDQSGWCPTTTFVVAWRRPFGALALVGLTLVALSVVVADRLARSIVQPTQRLAAAARRLGDGNLDVQVPAEGPDELRSLAGAFNELGRQVSTMLTRERELVAELSHRLRTPLTALTMRIDQVDDDALAAHPSATMSSGSTRW